MTPIFDLFFGYDYFIAHRSVDGKPYAAALYDALTAEGNELDCFLDVKHYGAGGRLPWMQSRALNKTSRRRHHYLRDGALGLVGVYRRLDLR